LCGDAASPGVSGSRRAQVVLAAAVVVAVALVPMLVAYLQLGHPPDAAAEAARDDGVDDARRYLDRATTGAAADARGANWTNRTTTFRRLNDSLADATARLEARGAARDRTYRVGYAPAAATRVAERACPRGDGRAFGPCEALGGVVVQERAGETAVVAVAFTLRVRSPRGATNATVVVRPVA
jgi:hypothetical protein